MEWMLVLVPMLRGVCPVMHSDVGAGTGEDVGVGAVDVLTGRRQFKLQ